VEVWFVSGGGGELTRLRLYEPTFQNNRGATWKFTHVNVHLPRQDLVFGVGLAGALKQVLQQKGSFEDIMSNEIFLNRWKEALKARSDERAAEKVLPSDEHGMEDEEEQPANGEFRLNVMRPTAGKNRQLFAQDTKEYWDSYAGELVRQYVRLAEEPTSASALTQVIQGSVLERSYKGQQGANCVMTVLEVDNLWESTCRPWDKRPSVNQATINKLLQGSMAARDGAPNEDGVRIAPCDGDLIVLCDGGRESLKPILRGP
jgi:hypothetical protein